MNKFFCKQKDGSHNICSLFLKIELKLREYGSSGEDVSVNAVIIPKNWWAMMTAFTNTSDPELLYSHCWQVNLVKNHVLVFFGGSLIVKLSFNTKDPPKKTNT